jgi:hypothetical protein
MNTPGLNASNTAIPTIKTQTNTQTSKVPKKVTFNVQATLQSTYFYESMVDDSDLPKLTADTAFPFFYADIGKHTTSTLFFIDNTTRAPTLLDTISYGYASFIENTHTDFNTKRKVRKLPIDMRNSTWSKEDMMRSRAETADKEPKIPLSYNASYPDRDLHIFNQAPEIYRWSRAHKARFYKAQAVAFAAQEELKKQRAKDRKARKQAEIEARGEPRRSQRIAALDPVNYRE